MERIYTHDINRGIWNIQDETNPHEKNVNSKWKFPWNFICNFNSFDQSQKDKR